MSNNSPTFNNPYDITNENTSNHIANIIHSDPLNIFTSQPNTFNIQPNRNIQTSSNNNINTNQQNVGHNNIQSNKKDTTNINHSNSNVSNLSDLDILNSIRKSFINPSKPTISSKHINSTQLHSYLALDTILPTYIEHAKQFYLTGISFKNFRIYLGYYPNIFKFILINWNFITNFIVFYQGFIPIILTIFLKNFEFNSKIFYNNYLVH